MVAAVTGRNDGMQKSGMARAVQAKEWKLTATHVLKNGELTESYNVRDQTDDTHIEISVLDVSAAAEERDCDWNSITQSQADDTDTWESVECSWGAEVEDTEKNLDNHTQHHGVQWYIELWVDLLPPFRSWDSTVTREGPCASRSGSRATDTAEDSEHKDRNAKTECSTRAANSGDNDNWEGLTREESNKHSKIWDDEQQADQEDEATEEVKHDRSDHSSWNLGAWRLYFFAHATSC